VAAPFGGQGPADARDEGRQRREDRRRPGAGAGRAYAEADETAREGIEEMQLVNGAALENLGSVLDQLGRTWSAGDARADADIEAGQ